VAKCKTRKDRVDLGISLQEDKKLPAHGINITLLKMIQGIST
jgi:hypothetical protein